jgi:hypothetical protein
MEFVMCLLSLASMLSMAPAFTACLVTLCSHRIENEIFNL